MYKTTIDKASVVFKEVYEGKYEALKSRDDQIKLGGYYSEDFVDFYTQMHEGVLILGYGKICIEKLNVGDYVKVVSSDFSLHEYKVGEVVKVVMLHTNGNPIVKSAGRQSELMYLEQLIRATEEEVIEAQREATAEKWANIGRTFKEFKVGDAVQYKNAFTTVVKSVPGCIQINQSNNVAKQITVRPADLKLVFPVEARFDLE